MGPENQWLAVPPENFKIIWWLRHSAVPGTISKPSGSPQHPGVRCHASSCIRVWEEIFHPHLTIISRTVHPNIINTNLESGVKERRLGRACPTSQSLHYTAQRICFVYVNGHIRMPKCNARAPWRSHAGLAIISEKFWKLQAHILSAFETRERRGGEYVDQKLERNWTWDRLYMWTNEGLFTPGMKTLPPARSVDQINSTVLYDLDPKYWWHLCA